MTTGAATKLWLELYLNLRRAIPQQKKSGHENFRTQIMHC